MRAALPKADYHDGSHSQPEAKPRYAIAQRWSGFNVVRVVVSTDPVKFLLVPVHHIAYRPPATFRNGLSQMRLTRPDATSMTQATYTAMPHR